MLKVFIVEDECLVREGIRDNISWKENGFEFVGEAEDGEMALPLIRKTRPNLLITDIKMPFMDGLELSRIVSKEMPDTKIIILSGYDDFEFAREAIKLNVDQYLLKPITRAALEEALAQIKEKIEKEQEQKNYDLQYIHELQNYEQYETRKFFEEITAGTLKVGDIYHAAEQLEINIDAGCYNFVLFTLQPQSMLEEYSDVAAQLQDNLIESFIDDENYILFRCNLTTFAVLVKGETADIDEITRKCVDSISGQCESLNNLDWYVAEGTPVERLSALPKCYNDANSRISLRHIYPAQHIFGIGSEATSTVTEDISSLDNLDVEKIDPMITRNFLQTGLDSEIDRFVENYLRNLGTAIESLLFRQYILLSARFNAAIVAKGFGENQDAFLKSLPEISTVVEIDDAKNYLISVFKRVIEVRDAESKSRYNSILKNAIAYIDEHFADEDISLNTVARTVNVSANYFSAIFSQETGETFIEYLTKKRMEKAMQLLRQTSMRSGEIAFQVGYRDPRYFSFIFRKAVGCTPRDYRGEK
ncbi:MAG: response regulator transcription factor [Lachnospiraceae bacterium]|nr:response regulator transcription factor [Lachnospiraceae bacterium]